MTIDPFSLDEAQYGEPLSLVIGQSSQWRRDINIDSTLFSVKYVLRQYEPTETPVDYSVDMIAHTDGVFAADVSPSDIQDWAPGRYFWDLQIVRTSDDRTKTVETGEFHIFGNVTDRRSHAEIMVVKIESLLQNRADNDVESYTIKSRSITKMSMSDLREWRDYYMREINNKPQGSGVFVKKKANASTIKVRFTD